jgi:integration host factor beta subunit
MTKRDLIEQIASRFSQFAHKDVEVMVNSVLDTVVDAMTRGERIEIRGFGSFVVKKRRAREGRNPKTGAVVSVAPKCVPFFKVGKELRLKVDRKGTEASNGPEGL